MLKKLTKINKHTLTAILFITLCTVFLLPNFVLAVDFGMSYGDAIGLGTGDPRVIAVSIIRVALTFIGIIAVAIIMYSGFLWMTSEGDPAKLDKAKKTLKNAVIGLIIILSAWAIVTFILNKLMGIYGIGGPGPGAEPPGPDWGLGALGSCTIENVYPEPYQKEVPRNTAIIVTFREEVDPTTICDDAGGNGDGDCDSGEYIIPEHIRIFKTSVGDGCPLPCTGNVLEVNVATNDNKTFVFMPVNYLGSPSEYIDYAVYLSNDIRKLSDGSGVFNTCSTDYFQWQFEVSNKIDLTPPQVKEGGVFPAPDNEADEVGTETAAVQATGSVTVDNQPDVYAAASLVSVIKNPPAGVWNDAAVVINEHCQESGVLTVTVLLDGLTAQLNKGVTLLGSAVFSGDSVDFSDYFTLQVLGDGSYAAGNSWDVDVTSEVQADTLTVGSIIYTFVNVAPIGNQIQLGAGVNGTAGNIAAALAGHPDVTAAAVLNVVTTTAKVAGVAGNNIVLSSDSEGLTITSMSGGQDIEVTTTVKDRSDKPRNAIIQVNFNEAINPMTVSGSATEVENYIRVINNLEVNGAACFQDKECASNNCVANVCVGVPALLINGAACGSHRECLSFNCDTGICNGNVINGKFMISNQYRTVEFISDNLCGVNGCGEQIYCLPENSHLKVELIAADLVDCCPDCTTKSPYSTCSNAVCALGNCQNSALENYPMSVMPLNGIADMAMNSLDGDRSEDAEGPVSFYNENITAGPGDNYQWSFFISDQIDLSPPVIDLVNPAHSISGVSLTDPILIEFSKVMMSSSLSTGSTVIFNGKDYVTHQLINLWNFTNQPLGYWVTKKDIDDNPLDGEPDWTQAQLKHSSFADTTSYRAQVGSGVKDIYQNCFKPSSGPGCVGGPSCCGGVPDVNSSCD